LQATRARAVLQEIEVVKRTKYHETTALAPSLTVEHVMPQQWQLHWPMADGNKPTSEQTLAALYNTVEDDTPIGHLVQRNRLVQSFGNLTLLTQPLNTVVSNGPYKDWTNGKGKPQKGKRTALHEHSLLVMNREITVQENWDEGAIVERGESLFALAKAIWKLPVTNAAEE
jgi:hypothetical protein